MSTILFRSRRDRLATTLRQLHEDEEGLQSIEMVLILCAAAVVLGVGFKALWGTDGKSGFGSLINTNITKITSLFTWWQGDAGATSGAN